MNQKQKEYQREYQRRYYHSKELREQRRLAKLKRRHRNKLRAIKILGGKCIECGYNDPRALDFHHPDPSVKEYDCYKLWHRKWEVLEMEIKKCELLCANCHRIKHSSMDL